MSEDADRLFDPVDPVTRWLAGAHRGVSRGGRPAPADLWDAGGVGGIRGVAVVGANGAGKSHLLSRPGVVEVMQKQGLRVAARVVTRPARPNEVEAVDVVDASQFRDLRDRGDLALSWERRLAGQAVDLYGCRPTPPGTLAVFIGGHGLYDNESSVQPQGVLRRLAFIGVHAGASRRADRLRDRSSVRHRASAPPRPFDEEMLRAATHVVVDNDEHETTAARALADVLAAIANEVRAGPGLG